MAGRYVYTIGAPALASPEDVVILCLHGTVAGTEIAVVDVAIGGSTEVVASEGEAVSLYFTAKDEGGNESAPGGLLEFVVEPDDVPPSAPLGPQVLGRREVFDEPTPEPEPEPTP